MLARYLGNKTGLLGPILGEIKRLCRPGGRVCDVFSGTLSVSLAAKRSGFSMIANDINLFSWFIGQALLVNNDVPKVPLRRLLCRGSTPQLVAAECQVAHLRGEGYEFLANPEYRDEYVKLLALLKYLEGLDHKDLPEGSRRTHIFDTYTASGRLSAFVSSRGSKGRRSFFSEENGLKLDAILNQLRVWYNAGLLEDPLRALLLTVLIRAVEKVSNTQGTYHDFPRAYMDPRALQPLRFDPPPLDGVLSGGIHVLGKEEDSLSFIQHAPAHDVLYIDPPYNFRQYTSYYFMPNMICRYPEIPRLDDYFSKVQFVRGQNMTDDFPSTFCSKKEFLPSLRSLISRAKTKHVILSYFDGRNHWNDFKKDSNGVGRQEVENLFESDLFVPGSLRTISIPRANYQSYGGHKSREVLEYLFVAEKA